jgi:ubiquinone/menaquinone biosynthesis C-methylase UbiE
MYHIKNRANTNSACHCWENKQKKNIKYLLINNIDNYLNETFDNICQLKNSLINTFILNNNITSVAELGCGDGNRSLNGNYTNHINYIGYDKNKFAINLANITISNENRKYIHWTNDTIFDKKYLTISLDIVNNIDTNRNINEYNSYVKQLFDMSKKYVIIFFSDYDINNTEKYINNNIKNFTLIKKLQKIINNLSTTFIIYKIF